MSATTAIGRTDEPPNPVRAQYEAATRALKAGNVEEAESICRKVLPVHGRDPNILRLLGEICLCRRRLQEGG